MPSSASSPTRCGRAKRWPRHRRPRRLDPNTAAKTIGGDVVQLKGDKQNIRIEFKGQTTSREGETKVLGVKIMVDNRDGRNYVVTGKEAFIGQQNSSFDVRGDVKLQTSDGLTALSQHATYADAEKIVRVPGAVTFTRGRMSGSGIGFTYDEQRDTMWILDKADVKFAAEGTAGPMAFTAGTFGYARRDRYMRLEKTLHIDREGQLIDATESTVRLFPDRDEPDYLELRGGSKITGGPKDNALRGDVGERHQHRLRRRWPVDAECDPRGERGHRARGQAGDGRPTPERQLHGHRPRAGRQRAQPLDARQRHGHVAGGEGYAGADHSIDRAGRRRKRAGPQPDELQRGRRVPGGRDQDPGRPHARARSHSKPGSNPRPGNSRTRDLPATSTSPMGRCTPSATMRATT